MALYKSPNPPCQILGIVPTAAHLSAHLRDRLTPRVGFVCMCVVVSAIRESFIHEMLYFIEFTKVFTHESFRLYGLYPSQKLTGMANCSTKTKNLSGVMDTLVRKETS